MKTLPIAIPGEHTTANLLLGIRYPVILKKTEYLFSDIEEAVLSGEVDTGLIIHENRFTFEKKGLRKIIDLGDEGRNAIRKLYDKAVELNLLSPLPEDLFI